MIAKLRLKVKTKNLLYSGFVANLLLLVVCQVKDIPELENTT